MTMTNEFDQGATDDLGAAEPIADDLSDGASADISVSFGDHKLTSEDLKDAAKWTYRKLFGHEEQVEPGGISIDLEDHEEVTTRSSSVAHEDRPPPPFDAAEHD
jgi:hypothetical protein